MKVVRSALKFAGEVKDFFTAEHVSLMPFVADVKNYNRSKFRLDLRASGNVTVLAVCQGIAFSAIAGLPVVYGMICAAVAAFFAPIFSGSRHTVLGPTNASALMFFSFLAANPLMVPRIHEWLPILVLMIGVLATLGAFARVADLLQYVSRSVLVGFVTAAACMIILNQMKNVLGVASAIDSSKASSFIGILIELILALPKTSWLTLGIAVATFLIYYMFRRWRPNWPAFALTLVLASASFGPWIHQGFGPFAAIDTFKTFQLHELRPELPNIFRESIFADISSLLSVAFAIAFLASLENSMMSKSLASKSGDRPDIHQDMLAVGMANLACSITGGMPASASLTRSQLNQDSGAETRFSSMLAGVSVMLCAVMIASSVVWKIPLLDFVPKTVLAALVIAVSFSIFNTRHLRICMKTTRDDAVVLVTTLIATLLAPLHVAIFIGVAISIGLFLRRASKPHLVEYGFNEDGALSEMLHSQRRPIPAISIVHVEGDLFFGAADLFRTQIQRTVQDPAIRVIILRLKNAHHLDATSVMALEELIVFMRGKGLHLIVSGASREIYRLFKSSGILETLQAGCVRAEGETNLFLTNPQNPNLSTRDALRRAQQLLGNEKADIRIFYDPNAKTPSS
ncbi:MAG: SulP family inorganic anion transporter [Verrucomicrobia bacterium]|nr:MAG: SulP family inorganic anion transporter [Verrucomicrobiota bacterium]